MKNFKNKKFKRIYLKQKNLNLVRVISLRLIVIIFEIDNLERFYVIEKFIEIFQ